DSLPFLIFGKNMLLQLVLIIGNDTICRIDNILRGTVVLLQFENFQIGIVFLEIENVLDVCSPESIDALGVIANHADVLIDGCQFPHDEVLGKVGILVLINHHILEFVLILMEHFGVFAEKHVGFEQQIIKIHGARFVTALGIR